MQVPFRFLLSSLLGTMQHFDKNLKTVNDFVNIMDDAQTLSCLEKAWKKTFIRISFRHCRISFLYSAILCTTYLKTKHINMLFESTFCFCIMKEGCYICILDV